MTDKYFSYEFLGIDRDKFLKIMEALGSKPADSSPVSVEYNGTTCLVSFGGADVTESRLWAVDLAASISVEHSNREVASGEKCKTRSDARKELK